MPPPSDVFDPAGISWTPISPALASVRRTVLGITAGVLAVVVVVLAVLLWSVIWIALLVPALLLGIGWVVVGRQVAAYGYAERSEDLLIRRGVMFRALVVVPYGRMQFVDVQAGPLDRAFGVAKLQLHTASAGTDAVIPGVSVEEAARLRDRLSSRGRSKLAGL